MELCVKHLNRLQFLFFYFVLENLLSGLTLIERIQ